MNEKYVLSRRAASNLVRIWRHLRQEAGDIVADRVESVIKKQIEFLAENPGIGHIRGDLTVRAVRFFLVYSWFIVYRPETKPLQVVAIIHGRRDLPRLLKESAN